MDPPPVRYRPDPALCKGQARKLSSMEYRGQTDRTIALPRSYALDMTSDLDIWPSINQSKYF